MSQIKLLVFFRFLFVGGSATIVHYAVMATSMHFFDVAPGLASALGYMIAAAYNYTANYLITFKSRSQHRRAIPRFVAVAIAGLGLNQAVLLVLISAGLFVGSAQIVATLAVLLWNYLLSCLWTFAPRNDAP
ncbi:GtrA family protein [Nostoc sp. CHAB 5834]|nr:GtrA family protein [Nostoc sp. CHAB 5834]